MNPLEDRPRKVSKTASRAALLAWLAWLASCGLLWWQARACVMHPHFFPLVCLLLIQLLATADAVCLGLWRTVRGPRRLAAFSWALVALIPMMLWVAHGSYVLGCLHEHTLPMNPATRTALVGGAALADGEARIRFPRRLSSQRVVMIYDRLADPAGDLAAMDRHVAELEGVVGRPGRGKIRWVRGTLLGMGPRGFQGLATGFAEHGPNEVDRHEVAHVVINQHLPAAAEPPTVLTEGWAESHQGSSPERLARRAWSEKSQGLLYSLRELVGPEWYFRMEHPVYVYGAALVDYLLREYGADKFLQLYTTCRQETFAADCERVLGVGLDELEEQFWADVRERIAEPMDLGDQSISARLGLPEAGPIDDAACEQFLSQYRQAAERLEAAYADARISAVKVAQRVDDVDGEPRPPDITELELIRSGERARLVTRSDGYVLVWVAAPDASFFLKRRPGDDAFDLRRFSSGSKRGYRRILQRMQVEQRLLCAAYGIVYWDMLAWMAQPAFRVTGVSHSEKDGKSLVTASFEFVADVDGEPLFQAGWFSVFPDDGWAMQEYELRVEQFGKRIVHEGHVEYAPEHGGIPELRRVRLRSLGDDGRDVQITVNVKAVEFGPAPDAEFRLATFGVRPSQERKNLFARLLRFTLWALASVTLTLVLSVALQVVRRRA